MTSPLNRADTRNSHNHYPHGVVNEFKVNRWMFRNGFRWHHEVEATVDRYWERHGLKYSQSDAINFYTAEKRWWKLWM